MAKEKEDPHFDISSAVVIQLGQELVTDEVTAIMELVKNAYDADSPWVNVEVSTNSSLNGEEYRYNGDYGYIIIGDKGFGMTESDIREGWLFISRSGKRKMKKDGLKTPEGRTPLGDKGLGRLSTQRLGQRLELITAKEKAKNKIHVALDWSDFKEEIPLSKVPIYYNDNNPNLLGTRGTTLVITKLRDANAWTGKNGDKFKGQLSQLIFPYKGKRTFNVFLKINGQPVDFDELNENVRKNAVGLYEFIISEQKITIKGTIKLQKLNGSNKAEMIEFFEKRILTDNGNDFFNYLSDPLENKDNYLEGLKYSGKNGVLFTFQRTIQLNTLDQLSWIYEIDDQEDEDREYIESDEKDRILAYPGDFQGEIDDFFFKETDSIKNTFDSMSEFKRIVQNQLGVRIFRDGFGIKPYGIDGNDWLNLSGGQTSGTSFYGLRPGNVTGFVAISADVNKKLTEKTDREGFADSPYSKNFFRIMECVINEVNQVLEGTRRSYNGFNEKKSKEISGIQSTKDSFQKLKNTSAKAKNIRKKAKDIRGQLATLTTQVKGASNKQPNQKKTPDEIERQKLLDHVLNLLKVAEELLDDVESVLEDAQQLDQHVAYLQPQIESLEQQLADFSELAGLGLTAEALSHELSNIVDRMMDETDRINKRIKGKSNIDTNSISIYIEYIKHATRSFRKQLSHLAPSLRYVRENKQQIKASDLLAENKEYYTDKFKGEIEIITELHGSDFTLKVNRGKLTQIIDNLVINSEYWVLERKKAESKFRPKITIEMREPFIRIFDNGYGIEPNIQDRVFQPFISAKPKKIGRGLGLFIVQQLMESIACDITLLSEKNSNGRRYIFQLNMSSIIEE